MTEKIRKVALSLTAILLSGSLLTACSGISVSGGVIGSVLSLLGIVALVLSLSTTQSSCAVGPCLQPGPETIQQDGGTQDDTHIGPCLTARPPDERTQMEPCLGAPLPEKSGYLQTPGVSPHQPGMDVPTRDGIQTNGARTTLASRDSERQSAIARLQQRGILPPDVANRLKSDKDSPAS